MIRFNHRGGDGVVIGSMGSSIFCFWVISCCFFLCIVNTQAASTSHNQNLPSASGLSRHHQENVPESLRSARSSLGLPMSSPGRSDDTFWAMRGKRPETDVNTSREEHTQHSRSLASKQIDSNTDDEAYTTDKEADEDPRNENDISEKGENDGAIWFDQDKEADDGDENMLLQKRSQPYWISRGKKGISDYIPFYWGSNQNVWGKMPLRRTPSPVARSEPNQSNKIHHSNVVSGWESNQSFWGKRSDNGPFWISRGKKQDSNPGAYWIARGKRPFYTDQYWGSNPLSFGKRTNGEENEEGITEFQESELPQKREDNGPFWVSRGRRSKNTTFWVPRGKKAVNGKELEEKSPFWIARGKKAEDTSPFWIARGKKEDETPTNFWVARGKKDNDKAPYWIARGKKETDTPTEFWVARGKKDNDKVPYWIARGKKEDEIPTDFWVARGKKDNEKTPYWIARGKKESETPTPFWVARGKKENNNPYWISRGKKEDPTSSSGTGNPFWVSRGKKEGESYPYWITRGKKEPEITPFWVSRGKKSGSENPFWVTRGKKDDPEEVGDGSFWISRGRRPFWVRNGMRPQFLQEKDHDLLMAYIIEAILRGQATDETDETPGLRGKKGSSSPTKQLPQLQKDDSYARGFVALRG